MNAADPQPEAVPVRAAATLLLVVDDPLRVLMVLRSAHGFFPSALVFPGGTLDADDHGEHWLPHLAGHDDLEPQARALRIAAWRETWEETGVAPHGRAQAAQRPPLIDSLRAAGTRIELGGTVPFGHWVTPATVAKRYDTHFFLAAAPAAFEPAVDGHEIVAAQWLEPREVIARSESGDRSILFSTLANLHLLAQARSVREALDAARTRPVVPAHPRREERDGEVWVSIPESCGYPLSAMRFVQRAGPELTPVSQKI